MGEERESPRAEEIIVEVYRQRTELLGAGREATRVVMSRDQYDVIQSYHAHLGEMPDGAPDYIGRYDLFGLEICIERVESVRVE